MWASSQAKNSGIGDRAVLDHLREPGLEFALRQRLQRVGVDQNETRLVKRTDQVLALRMVDPGLAADR